MVGSVITKMILFFGTDTRRIHHAMKVYSFACALWDAEAADAGPGDDDARKTALLCAAVLHDIGITEAERKYHSSAGKYQEIEGPPIARQILRSCGAGEELISRVCYLVGHHHTYHMIDGLDFQILVESDLLVNLEEDRAEKDAILSVREKYMKTAGSKKILDDYLMASR